MLIFDDYKEIILKRLRELYPDISQNDVELGRDYGDFTLKIFKLKEDPKIILKKIKENLSEDFIERIDLQGNYINFFIRPENMLGIIYNSIKDFGYFPNTFQDTSKVLIEHTSANPTGPIHVGRIRNSIIGDSIYKILERYGYRSCTQYFVNDSGKQVISLYLGHVKYHKNEKPDLQNLLDGYQRIYREMETNKSIENEIEALAERYEKGDKELIDNIQHVASIVLDSVKASLKKIGIEISTYVWESNFILYGDVNKMLESISENLKSEGSAKYIEIGDKKIFLTRADGTSLYFSRDIVYHLFKQENFDWLVDVLGEDHKDHAKNLEYVLKTFFDFQSKIDFVFYGFVSLENGKMSTRKGRIVTLDDLYEKTIEESVKIIKEKRPDYDENLIKNVSEAIAASSIRFNIVRVNANKPIVFKWSEALNFEGDSAPYIMYSYARACSVLRKSSKSGGELGNDYNKYEKDLIRVMYSYPYSLKSAVEFLRPDIIANYLLNLSKAFNEFYLNCPVINTPEESKRILLIMVYKNIMEDASKLIGIKLLDEI